MPTNPKFYTGRTWRKFRQVMIAESNGQCNRCKQVFSDTSKLHVHHIKYLKGDDYDDPTVAFAKDNVEVICHTCHNAEHDRFANRKEVILVFGPPLSGKSSYVKEMKSNRDIVLDLDLLKQAITMESGYERSTNASTSVLFRVRDTILDIVKVRYGSWKKAWIIGTYPNTFDRELLIQQYGVDEVIFMDETKEECLMRLDLVDDERSTYKTEWIKYIDEWFETYTPPSNFNFESL